MNSTANDNSMEVDNFSHATNTTGVMMDEDTKNHNDNAASYHSADNTCIETNNVFTSIISAHIVRKAEDVNMKLLDTVVTLRNKFLTKHNLHTPSGA